MTPTSLEKGRMYRFRYRLGNQRRDRELTAQFLEYDAGRQEYVLNMRPVAGTTSLPVGSIISIARASGPPIRDRVV